MSWFEKTVQKKKDGEYCLYVQTEQDGGIHIESSHDQHEIYSTHVFKLSKEEKEGLIKVLQNKIDSYMYSEHHE